MEYPKVKPEMPKEHLEIANKMAAEIIERYQPHEQNECMKAIRDAIASNRKRLVEEAKERVEYLAKSLEGI